MNKKIFISMPMKDKSHRDILEEMKQIMTKNFPDDILLDSACENSNNSIECLSYSIYILSKADLVVFTWDAINARGCKIEKMICDKYNIPYIILPRPLNFSNYILEDIFNDDIEWLECTSKGFIHIKKI